MENNEIYTLREWAPLAEIFEKIPTTVQKGLFPSDLNLTCIDSVPEFLALGSDAGIVFWYNRYNGEVQKLRVENPSPITCLRVVSSVEYMVAAGSANGQVTVFQIQKELPADLQLAAPLMKVRPIERYTIRDLHKTLVTCCEWSKNGMKLFSGDKQGSVVLTEFDYQSHLSKSVEILNEAYDIVQLSVHQTYLLVSTVYRTIICQRQPQTGQWHIAQVGKTDRKVLSDFGATFLKPKAIREDPKLICSRPGLRFWIADCSGNVEHTLLFKDAINITPCWEIPILNPSRNQHKHLTNFTTITVYEEKYAITHNETALYILNLEKLQIEAIARNFRKILDVCICGKEIFVLEGSRSLIRIAPSPEPPNKSSKIIFNPLFPPPIPLLGSTSTSLESPIEYEADEDVVLNAEECFESSPIEANDQIFSTQESSPTDQTSRFEIFNQIGEMKFEDSILFRSGKKFAKQVGALGKRKKKAGSGVVEIGQAIADKSVEQEQQQKPLTTKPTLLDVSFCSGSDTLIPDPMSPNTLQKILEPKERALAEEMQLQPMKLEEISEEDLKKSATYSQAPTLPAWYSIPKLEDIEVQTTPRKMLHFINDDNDESISFSTQPLDVDENLKTLTISSRDEPGTSSGTTSEIFHNLKNDEMPPKKSLQFVPTQPTTDRLAPGVPKLRIVPNPNPLRMASPWSANVEPSDNPPSTSDSNTSSEWEFVNNV